MTGGFRRGEMRAMATLVPITDPWLTFWIDHEIFYALGAAGEIYVLRYVP